MNDTIEVSEIFSTIQGEGPYIGQPALFVRLRRCNLSCSWCDTKFTWDRSNAEYNDRQAHQLFTPRQLTKKITDMIGKAKLVVITGGEPLIWQRQLYDTVMIMDLYGRYTVQFETNGTIAPILYGENIHYVVSPKLANSGMPARMRLKDNVLEELAAKSHQGDASFKFVVQHESDLDEIAELQQRFMFATPWIMMEGSSALSQIHKMMLLSDLVIERGWNLTPRLHILLWQNARRR